MRLVLNYARLVKFEHTIFALPFALTALLLANPIGVWPNAFTVFWVVIAMVGGRTFAMGLNRIADARLDALNARTAGREIPAGAVTMAQAWMLTLAALGMMVYAVFQLPLLCQKLLPVAVLILAIYSFTKRFTSLCHVVLGIALGSSAIGGWLAQTGSWNTGLPLWFGAAVTFWVTGFDIIYACQDTEFDRAQGLFSIPARLGNAVALQCSQGFHFLSMLTLFFFIVLYGLHPAYHFVGLGFLLATILMAVQLIREHRLVRADDLSRVNEAFFTLNGQISIGFFLFVLVDRVLLSFSPAYYQFSLNFFNSLNWLN